MSPTRTTNGLPVTAYLVLGVLAAYDEQLTAGEIKTRAELSVGHFYWSPSVSHVRRELNRLLARGMVSEIGAQSGKRAITLPALPTIFSPALSSETSRPIPAKYSLVQSITSRS